MSKHEDNTEANVSLRHRLWSLPKVDLHRHLEGSLRVETLATIARENGINLPSYCPEHLRPLVTVADQNLDFPRFLAIFALLRHFYASREAVERLAYEAVLDAARDNVKYLELRFNPIALAKVQGFALSDVVAWVCEAVAKAQQDVRITVSLILQIGRDEHVDTASEIAALALAYRDQGVVGIDLAGDEISYPAGRFALVFRRVREDGLHVTVHAGEAGRAANVREAIEELAAQRIGHGISVVEDPAVVALARERGVVFEVCPLSNLATGVAGRSGPHPLRDMVGMGLQVTINTDDPSIIGTTLTDDYLAAVQTMGLTVGQVRAAVVTAAESAFVPDGQRQQLAAWFRGALSMA